MLRLATSAAAAALLSYCAAAGGSAPAAAAPAAVPAIATGLRAVAADGGERHLANVRQLTFGGENAEAYFSANGDYLTFQGRADPGGCDQQWTVRTADGGGLARVSPAPGKTTCGFFYGDDRRVLFGSTHDNERGCPAAADKSKGYVWKLDKYDIYTAARGGGDVRRLTRYGTYTAEAVVSPDGRRIVFTSRKDGDLDIYTMDVDGSNVRRLTTTPGYDGGPWWSPDGTRIVYRAWHPADSAGLADYRALLSEDLVRPSRMELWTMNADGSDQRQITRLGGANFGPSWTADGRRIIFSSNYRQRGAATSTCSSSTPTARGGVEQVTTNETFDGLPDVQPDGRRIVWACNRNAARPGTRTCSWPTGGSEESGPRGPPRRGPPGRRGAQATPQQPAPRQRRRARRTRGRPPAARSTAGVSPEGGRARAPRPPRGIDRARRCRARRPARAGRARPTTPLPAGAPRPSPAPGRGASRWPRRAPPRSSRRPAGGRWPARRRAGTGWGCAPGAARPPPRPRGRPSARRRRGTPRWGAGRRGRRRPGSRPPGRRHEERGGRPADGSGRGRAKRARTGGVASALVAVGVGRRIQPAPARPRPHTRAAP
jgi:Tol biopolymer transport system component